MLAPLMATLKKEGELMPEGFSAKSKCIPGWEDVRGELEKEFEATQKKVWKKCNMSSIIFSKTTGLRHLAN